MGRSPRLKIDNSTNNESYNTPGVAVIRNRGDKKSSTQKAEEKLQKLHLKNKKNCEKCKKS